MVTEVIGRFIDIRGIVNHSLFKLSFHNPSTFKKKKIDGSTCCFTTKKNATPYDVGNPGLGLGQAQ
jgi:hypothetical protein